MWSRISRKLAHVAHAEAGSLNGSGILRRFEGRSGTMVVVAERLVAACRSIVGREDEEKKLVGNTKMSRVCKKLVVFLGSSDTGPGISLVHAMIVFIILK